MFNSVTYNSLISYECNYGYMMVGETVRRCERNKIWTGLQPICRGNIIPSGWGYRICDDYHKKGHLRIKNKDPVRAFLFLSFPGDAIKIPVR
jgi:hypothetical protein